MTTRPPAARRSTARNSARPKYSQLRETLRMQIESLPPDELMPSEHELCAQYAVSRITVRKALADLIHEGLLYTVQGKGTFVAARKFRIEWAQEMAGFHADMARRGLQVKVRVLEQAVVPADQRVAEELNLRPGDPVVKIVRLRFVDEQPFDIAANYTPWVVFPGLEKEDLARGSIYALISRYNGLFQHAHFHLQAAPRHVGMKARHLLRPLDAELARRHERTLALNGVQQALVDQIGQRLAHGDTADPVLRA